MDINAVSAAMSRPGREETVVIAAAGKDINAADQSGQFVDFVVEDLGTTKGELGINIDRYVY